MTELTGAEFSILSDPKLEVAKLYDLVDDELMEWEYIDGKTRKVKEKRQISLSADIIIKQDGYIVSTWSGHYGLRPDLDRTIGILEKIKAE